MRSSKCQNIENGSAEPFWPVIDRFHDGVNKLLAPDSRPFTGGWTITNNCVSTVP